MSDITQPLRLAVGSHQAGSGKGCAMNLISWENGDTTITDMPACSDPLLAKIVQRVNDTYCTHRDGDLLCPPCSLTVLELAHRTVGTAGLFASELDAQRAYVRIAADQAQQVVHLAGAARPRAEAAIAAALAWADDPSEQNKAAARTAAAAANAAAAAYAAAYAAANAAAAAYAATYAAAANAANAAAAAAAAAAAYAANAYAAAAADAAAAAANAADRRLALAHRAFDLFDQLASRKPKPTATAAATAAAYERMTEKVPA